MAMAEGGRERTNVDVRRITADDAGALAGFFAAIPEGDRTFFKEDVTDPAVIARWLADDRRHRVVAFVEGTIVGYAAVLKGVAWSSHVGEIRIVIAPSHRGRGIGRLLAQRAVVEARDLGVEKLVVELPAGNERLIAMFIGLGFEQEGRLRAQVRTSTGHTGDLVVLSHFLDALAAKVLPDDPPDRTGTGAD
jgi:L-amino acid N-acyltransferase YncA